MGQTVYLGISGGVDSALSAALLQEQGYDVVGVYMRNWSRDLPGFKCPWAQDLADAERVAVKLGIDLLTWDCEKEYKETVADYLVDAYAKGHTPNPDVMCNQTVKFGTFADRAFKTGADLIATGHYARTIHAKDPKRPAQLLRSADEHKDQTYFLWRVDGHIFNRVLFPIGDYSDKKTVREECAKRGLGIENKPDSDGICFIGPVGIRTFLLDNLPKKSGDIVEWETGKVLGKHDGAFLFTVGQRKGLNVGGGPAHYVVKTDVENNVVYVTSDKQCPGLWTQQMQLEDCHWISGAEPKPGNYVVRARHTGALREVELALGESPSRVQITFREPVRTVAAGQSAVLYEGLTCLGGGFIMKDPVADPPQN